MMKPKLAGAVLALMLLTGCGESTSVSEAYDAAVAAQAEAEAAKAKVEELESTVDDLQNKLLELEMEISTLKSRSSY